MANVLFIFLTSLFLLVGLDILWFKIYALKNVYTPQFSLLNQSKSFSLRMGSGVITWLILAGAMTFLVDTLVAVQAPLNSFFLYGFLMGFVIYGVYNGTNYATLQKYKLSTAIIDTTWGMSLQGITALLLGVIFNGVVG